MRSNKSGSKRRWVKRDLDTEFEIKISAYCNGLDSELVNLFTTKSSEPDQPLDEIVYQTKLFLYMDERSSEFSLGMQDFDDINIVLTYKQVPLCFTTTFESLLEGSSDRILEFVAFTDTQWKEFVGRPKAQPSIDEPQEIFVDALQELNDSCVEVEHPVSSTISINVKSAGGKSFLFESLEPVITIKEIYRQLQDTPLFNADYKLRFDGNALLATSDETLESLEMEDGDTIDYF